MRDAQATIVFLNKEKILKESGQDEFLLQHILQSFIEFDSNTDYRVWFQFSGFISWLLCK